LKQAFLGRFAAVRHTLPLHGSATPRKLAAVLLFLPNLTPAPIPARFML
jgi:hypothetical protein